MRTGTLAVWTTGESGLYTLQLTGIDGGGNAQTATSQVTVDNNPPAVEIINPWDDKQYLMEDDEWVSIDAIPGQPFDGICRLLARQFLSRSDSGFTIHVEMEYHNARCTDRIAQTALALPVDSPTMPIISYNDSVRKLEDDGTTINSIDETMTATVTKKADRVIAVFPNGFGMIMDSGGYTETHTVKVKAYDIAGNVLESSGVRFLVSHKPRPQTDDGAPTGMNFIAGERQQVLLTERRSYGAV